MGMAMERSEVLRAIWRNEFDLAVKEGGEHDYAEVWRRIADRYDEAMDRGDVELEDVSGGRSAAWASGRKWSRR